MPEKSWRTDVDEVPPRRTCGTMAVHERLLRTVPTYADARAASENSAWRARGGDAASRSGITVIPVVVHVVYRTDVENISDDQVISQIEALNRDYRKTNADVSTVPGVFASLAVDVRIEFELATTDPQGNPTSGITRTPTDVVSFSDNDNVKSTATGGADGWPADRYLNIWVCQISGLLGYAQFPAGPAATDGVVIFHRGFGTVGTVGAPFNLGRTATHEIAHWLNLRHIWGDDGSGCNGDDFVADTPNAASPNYGMPTFPHVTCGNGPNGDMFMNYMDYVDDAGMVMFTAGQVTRMQTALVDDRPTIGHPKAESTPPKTVVAYIFVRPRAAPWSRIDELATRTPQVVECHRITGKDGFLLKVQTMEIAGLEPIIEQLGEFGRTTTSIVQSSSVPLSGTGEQG